MYVESWRYTSGLLLSTMLPVPKDKRGNKSDSSNYRAIAISSILGKLFDSIIIQDQHVSLKTDDLQFGFKEYTSTITCTQLLKMIDSIPKKILHFV